MSWLHHSVAVVLLGLTAACTGDDRVRALPLPPCGDPRAGGWDERFVEPGISGPFSSANALVRLADGRLAVGGSFDAVIGQPVRNIATWDGVRWEPLGEGLPGIVLGLAREDEDSLWAVGMADPAERRTDYVARWDGARWEILVENIDGVRGITAVDGGVVVWGYFMTLDAMPAPGLAVWNGAKWSAPAIDAAFIMAVARTREGFCFGGRLGSGGALHDGAACWDGTTVTKLGTGSPHARLTALTRGPDDRWWAGVSLPSAEETVTGLAYLAENDTWQIVDRIHDWDGFFPSPAIHTIAFEDDGLVIAGRFVAVGAQPVRAAGLARWSQSSGWSTIAGGGVFPRNDGVRAMLADGTRLHIAGRFAGANATGARGVATIEEDHTVTPWTGGLAALAPYARITELATSRRGLVVGGAIVVEESVATSVALFDGSWHTLPGEPPDGEDVRVAVLADDSIVVSAEFLERFDGNTWRRLVGEPSHRAPVLAEAGGGFYFASRREDGDGTTEVLRWRDGELTSFGHLSLAVVELAAFEGELVAVVESPEGQRGLVIRRDSSWQLIPSAPSEILSVAVAPGFGLVVAHPYGNVSAWDGERWRVIRERGARAIAACEGGLYVAELEYVGGRLTSTLGFFDFTGWHVLSAPQLGGIGAIEPTTAGVYVADPSGYQPALRLWTTPGPPP